MTDLEMTKLCAEAIGKSFSIFGPGANIQGGYEESGYVILTADDGPYDPLYDDAQAMALVKKFPIDCLNAMCREGSKDFNRAIVECVAKMQIAKVPA